MSESNRPVMLELDEVSISFKTGGDSFDHGVHHVLDKVSMRIYEGESLGVVGRNGVGKTTMVRIMAGILAPTSGSISIAEGKSAALLSLGLGFKQDLSGRDNATLAAMIQGATRKEAEAVLEEIKEFSELGDSFEMPVKNYSAGMNARLGFTTALMTDVDILLIDEVLSVGDAHFRGKALQAMQHRITSEQTVVFVSHLAEHIKKLCDRAVWLHEGRVKMEGPAEDVVDAYQGYVKHARKSGRLEQQQKISMTDNEEF
jgi:homopolymeric O-antigen transport system ATP-binding protein